jgi:hypothetical protein
MARDKRGKTGVGPGNEQLPYRRWLLFPGLDNGREKYFNRPVTIVY